MNRFVWPLVGFLALALVLAVGVERSEKKGMLPSALIGRAAPQFSLPNLINPDRKVSSADLRGRWYLLNVWGTWCVECRGEHPVLLDIHRRGDVPIIGLNWKDDTDAALAWLAELGDPYEATAVDSDGRVAIDWGVYGAPETFLVDPQGIVVHRHVGALTHEIWHRDFVPRIAGGPRLANAP